MTRFLIPFVLTAGAALADDAGFDEGVLHDCLKNAVGDVSACIGSAANQCIEESGGGSTNSVVGFCMNAELEVWDRRLNHLYPKLRDQAREMDELNGPSAPSQGEALLRMQREWINFRDKKCAYEEALWGGGSGAGPAWTICMMQATAQQVLYLETAKID